LLETNQPIIDQLNRHLDALNDARDAVYLAIETLTKGGNEIKAIQSAIDSTERLWFHNELEKPAIDNGRLMKHVFSLLLKEYDNAS
jgi:hypothetical protein